MLGAKYGMKHLMVAFGATPARANVAVESAGLAGTCANIVTLTGGVPHFAVIAGAACLIGSRIHMLRTYERETGRTGRAGAHTDAQAPEAGQGQRKNNMKK